MLIDRIDLTKLNLNLLKALDALLEEESVSLAAEKLGVGQPAMSHSLAQLRSLLRDELLVRSGGRMVPTPKARALKAELRDILVRIERLIGPPPEFEPAVSVRQFRIAMMDSAASILLPHLVERSRAEAPGITFAIQSLDGIDMLEALDNHRIDLAFGSFRHGLDHHKTWLLYTDHYCAVFNSALIDASAPGFFSEGAKIPIVTDHSPEGEELLDRLRAAGMEPHVIVQTPHLMAIPEIVSRVPAISILHGAVAHMRARDFGLTIRRLPDALQTGGIPLSLLWHGSFDHAPDHIWLR
ncbi:MAG: LysR family transcriptional regulator, partial [Gammaproteobacteria bacterium]